MSTPDEPKPASKSVTPQPDEVRDVDLEYMQDLPPVQQPNREQKESTDRRLLAIAVAVLLFGALGLVGYCVVEHRTTDEITAVTAATSPFVSLSAVILAYYFGESRRR